MMLLMGTKQTYLSGMGPQAVRRAPWSAYLESCSGSHVSLSGPQSRWLCVALGRRVSARGRACDSRQTVARAASFGWLI